MSYSLHNPFLFSAFLDRRTFKNDEPSGNNDDNNDPSPSSTTTTPTFSSLTEASEAGYHGQAVNIAGKGLQKVEFADDNYNKAMADVSASVDNTPSNNTPSNNTPSNNSQPALSTSAQAQVGNVAQDENGNWYATVQIEGTNALGRDYSIDPKDNSQGPTFGANVSENIETLFPDEVEAAGGSSDYTGSITDTFKDTDVDSSGFDASTGTYTYEPVVENKTAAPTVEEVQSFSDTFAKNLAAGADTFEYNGNLYTTELASKVLPDVAASVPVDTNLLSSQEQALVDAYNAVPDSDESYTPDAATMAAVLKSQDKTSAIAEPLSVADQVAQYDGVDADALDEATTAANNAAAATALGSDDFSYTVLPTGSGGITGSDTGAGRNLDADLGVGGSSATVSAADLAAFQNEVGPIGRSYGDDAIEYGNIAAIPLDGGGNLLVNDSSDIYDKINADAAAAVDSRSVFEKAQDALFDDRDATSRAVSDAAGNLLNASGAVNPYGSALPDDNVVADLSGYANLSQEDFLSEAGSDVTPVTYNNAFGDEFTSKTGAALSDIIMEKAASSATDETVPSGYAGMSQNDFLEAAGSDVQVGKFYDAFGNEYDTNAAAAAADLAAQQAATPETGYGFTDYMGDLYKSVVGGGFETAAGKTSGVATGIDLLYNSGVFDQLGQGVMVNSSIPGLNAQVQEKLAENNALAAANPRSPTASRDYVADTVASLRAKGGEYAASVTPEMIKRIENAMPDMRPGKEGLDVLGRPYGTDLTATSLIAAGEAVDTLADIGIVAAGTATGMAPLAIGVVGATSFAEAGGAAADEVSQMIDQAAQLGQIKNADGSAVSAEQLAEVKRIAQGQAYAGAGGIAAVSDPLVAATLGAGKVPQAILKTPFMVQQLAKLGITTGSEFGSGYGEQVATNIAGQGAGVDVGTTEGATGSGLLEATGGVGAGTVSTGVDTAGKLLSRGPDQVIAEQRQAAVLDPSKSPTAGQIADSSVQSAYDSVITPAPEELLAITDQTETASESRITAAEELMRSQIDQTGMIKPDAIAKVADQLGLTLFEASEAGNRAIEGKMNDDADSLRARAEQSVIDTGGIPAELNAEINDLLSENPDVAASIVDDAFNRPFVSNTGQSRLQMASDMDAAPVVDTAAVSQPTVMDVSPAQQAINYGALQAQEAAYTAAKGATGDDAAAEAAGEAAYNNFLRNPSGLPEAPTEGIAPKVDTTSVGEASIAKVPASGIETVVAKSPDDIIAEQRAAAPVKTFTTAKGSTYDAFGDGTTVRDRAERGDGEVSGVQPRSQQTVFMTKESANEIGPLFQNTEIPTELVIDGDKAKLVHKEDFGPKKAGSDASATVTLSTEPEVGLQPVEIMDTSNDNSRNIHFGNEITEVSTVDADQAVTNKMDADNADTSVVETDDGVEVEIADDLFDAASKADQDVVTVNSDGTATVAVDPNAVATGTDLVVTDDKTTDVAVVDDKTTDVAVVDDKTTDVAVVDDKTTDVAVVDDKTTDVAVVDDKTTDVAVDPTVDLVTYTDVEDEPVEVEVDEPVVTADPVTVDPDVPDIFVPPMTSFNDDGEEEIECPEGYTMIETDAGPMCQKIITARSSIQRGGRFIRDQGRGYTGRVASLSSGSKGPGQKRKTRTTSRTERRRPTVRT